MKRSIVIALAVMSSFVISLGGITAAYAQNGLGGRPAKPDPNIPRSSSIFIHTLEAGETANDTVLVSNNSSEEQAIELYATDGMATGTGAFSCRQQAEEKQGVGGWIRLSETSVTLEAGEQKEVPFTIRIPGQVDVGEQNGCIVFQAKEQEADESGSMQLRFRSAVRVAIVVPGDIHKELTIDSFHAVREGGKYNYKTVVSNAGNVSTDANIKVTLQNLFGNEVYENGGEYPVLANERLDLQFQQEDAPFWGGFYTATVTAMYDTNPQIFGVEQSESLATIEGPRKTVFIMPSSLALIVYLVVLLIIAMGTYWLIKIHRRCKEQLEWDLYTVGKSDTLASLAEARGVSWKRIAKANKLKPPYQIKAGDAIKLPPYKITMEP